MMLNLNYLLNYLELQLNSSVSLLFVPHAINLESKSPDAICDLLVILLFNVLMLPSVYLCTYCYLYWLLLCLE